MKAIWGPKLPIKISISLINCIFLNIGLFLGPSDWITASIMLQKQSPLFFPSGEQISIYEMSFKISHLCFLLFKLGGQICCTCVSLGSIISHVFSTCLVENSLQREMLALFLSDGRKKKRKNIDKGVRNDNKDIKIIII